MGGLGSGCYARCDAKNTMEQYPSVNISALKKQDVLDSGDFGFVPWYWWGQLAVIASEFRGGLLVLHCIRRYDDGYKTFSQEVGLEQTPCNFGGLRDWFSCPHCGWRRGVLYAFRNTFACRKCLDLTYQSTREIGLVRPFKKQTNICKKLGGTGSAIPEKPKNMHWKTYDRLVSEYLHWGRSSLAVFEAWNAKLR